MNKKAYLGSVFYIENSHGWHPYVLVGILGKRYLMSQGSKVYLTWDDEQRNVFLDNEEGFYVPKHSKFKNLTKKTAFSYLLTDFRQCPDQKLCIENKYPNVKKGIISLNNNKKLNIKDIKKLVYGIYDHYKNFNDDDVKNLNNPKSSPEFLTSKDGLKKKGNFKTNGGVESNISFFKHDEILKTLKVSKKLVINKNKKY